MHYQIADRILDSDLSLPELTELPSGAADWRLMRAERAPSIGRPYHYWRTAGGSRWASFAHHNDQLLVHFARTASFAIDERRRVVAWHPRGRAGTNAIRPVVLNQLIPLLLGAERLVVHASAVHTAHGAVVFAGAPGMGKSTIAAALAIRGWPLISDDAVIVDQQGDVPRAVLSQPESRLWPDSVRAVLSSGARRFPPVRRRCLKRRITALGLGHFAFASAPAPIGRIFLLSPSHAPGSIERLAPAGAVAALTACTFVARVDDATTIRATFARVTALVARVPVYRLGIVRDYARLDALCHAVCAAA